ncbi:50S ribosomal protein L25/general stress protein Ctc [Paenisporosarcina cavernae]|uniref:Large ribosomal subunit protein bL25 n=1 Tax=Paenisporosarcina cavernae TaxID=2320858 RepID=A0A385YYH3_9BACL|nr:50S ribosomal protein L25/general stress protein Ctc [Paenisporosarcina cavernae]AYC30698.1 50S ribosomal protein L25/general stress protein Ctc [Paenisporosarcina cavernae]
MANTVKAQTREVSKRSNLTNLRGEGHVPAVVYGFKTESTPISVSEVDLLKTLREVGRNGVMSLDVDGKSVNVVLSDYQMDVLKGNFVHADFLAINMKDELEVLVHVVPTGDAAGVKEGGVLNQPTREVTIKVKPSDIPDSIELDVSELGMNETLTVEALKKASSYNILEEDDVTLFSVTAPRSDEELETTADEDAVGEAGDEETTESDSEETSTEDSKE